MCSKLRLALGGVALLCMTAPPLRAVAPELLGRSIRAVRLESDLPIDTAGLAALLPLQPGDVLTADQVAEAERLLRLKGIFRAITIDVEPVDEAVDVVVVLERKRVVGVVRASGYDALSRDDVRRLIRLEPGTIFDTDVVEAARDRIKKRYVDLGFPAAEVSIDETLQKEAVDLEFHIDEGTALRVHRIVLEGDNVIAPDIAQQAVRHLRKKRWTRDERRDTQSLFVGALRKQGYYSARVVCRYVQAADEAAGVITCHVEAGSRHLIELVGNQAESKDSLIDFDALNQRLLITDGTWRELARDMVRHYQADGYYRAKVRTEIEGEDPKLVRYVIDEGRKYRLASMRVRGNHAVSGDQLRTQMATQTRAWLPWPKGGTLQDDLLDDDLRRLWFLYREQGFDRAEILDAERAMDDQHGTIDLTIVIDEGPRTIIRHVTYEGLPQLHGTRPLLLLTSGKPLGPEALKQDRQTLTLAVAREGFADARVEPRIERIANASGNEDADIVWQVTPGARLRIGRVIVQNNIDTRDVVIRRELSLTAGDPLDTSRLLEAQTQVYQTGLFRSVLVRPLDPVPGAPADERDVAVTVVERPPGKIEWGAGYNTRDGILGSLDVGYDNLGGMNRRIGARLRVAVEPTQVSDNQYLANLNFREPRLFGSKWKFQSDIIAERSTKSIDPYSFERAAWSMGVDRKLSKIVRVGTEIQFEYRDVFDVEPDAVLTKVDEGKLHSVTPAMFVLFDRRDSVSIPRKGTFDTARVGYALPEISSVESIKLTGGHIHYVPLPKHLTLLYAFRAGWGLALSGSSQLPISDRFFLGGRSTVRGFGENDVGPEGQNGAPLGGDVSLNANLELQFPLVYGFEGAVFSDGGGVYLQRAHETEPDGTPICAESCAFTFENFRKSAGLGLRYITPIGPLSLDYGFKLDRRSGESIGAIHFSVGALF